MNLIGCVIFFAGLLSILLDRKHVLILLLCLEFMYLGVLYFMFMGIWSLGLSFSLIIFMFFIVCEAGMGLAILVSCVYFYGNDKVSLLSFVKC
uniref:NADH dehydrogenase subunit 4L n=1 Tax=Alectorobius peruvianus TaxID=879266 RepID=UPI002238E1DC|nr:NADH dehydrogenase subunit 4L [Alectorobius peruvianus]UYB78531.1 NADH dehydrogenase subunit 4L [Alectorobius peruvianus]